MLGERLYHLRFNNQHVGEYRTNTVISTQGNYDFSTHLTFKLAGNNTVQILEHLSFSGSYPHPLVQASFEEVSQEGVNRVQLQATQNGYAGFYNRDELNKPTQLNWVYRLADYLALEAYLRQLKTEDLFREQLVRSIDFQKMQLTTTNWRVLEHNDSGFLVSKAAAIDDTSIQLDQSFVPIRFRMAGLFEMERASLDTPIPTSVALHSQHYFIPLNTELANHTQLRALTLQVSGADDLDEFWPNLNKKGADWLLENQITVLPAETADESLYLSETLNYPSHHLTVTRLLDEAVESNVSSSEQVEQLTHFVHNYLSYQHQKAPVDVLRTIAEKSGDCTEYANLFTTLARAAGIPAKTITGLAYSGESGPGFWLHAWNQVLIDGVWVGIDPTWDQLRLDATHIPIPTDESHSLRLLAAMPHLKFQLVNAEYY